MAFKALGKWRNPIIIAALTVIFIALLMASKPEAPTQPSTEKSWQVSAVSAERVIANPEVELYARTESPHEAKLSTTMASDVTTLHALPGQSVKKGDVIIELDDTDAQIALMQAEADLTEIYAAQGININKGKDNQRTTDEFLFPIKTRNRLKKETGV